MSDQQHLQPAPPTEPNASPTSTRRALVVVALVVVVIGAGVTALRLTQTWPFAGHSELAALDYIPADVARAEIRNQAAAEQRLGIDDIGSGASPPEIEKYVKVAEANRWVSNEFTFYLQTMISADTAFTALDVEWSATSVGSADDTALSTLFGMDPELDLDVVGDALADAGWRESEVDGGRRFTVEMTDVELDRTLGGYPAVLGGLVLLPDEHLMLSGDAAPTLETIAGESDALASADGVQSLFEGLSGIEYAFVTQGQGSCQLPTAGPQPTPQDLEQLRSAWEESGLQRPSATGSFVVAGESPPSTTSRLLFADADQAETDRQARQKFLASGASFVSREAFVDTFEIDRMGTSGPVETIDYTFVAGPSRLMSAAEMSDVAPTYCFGF